MMKKFFTKTFWKNIGARANLYNNGYKDTVFIRLQTKYLLKKIGRQYKRFGHPCVIYTSYYDYYDKMTQRPQHFFNKLSKLNYPVVCCTLSERFSEPHRNLFVVPFRQLPYFIHARNFQKVFIIPYNFPVHDSHLLKMFDAIDDKTIVIYELIDNFDLLGNPDYIKQAQDMFTTLIKRDNTFVFTSANKLYNTALKFGCPKNKLIMNKNGVNLEDFQGQCQTNQSVQEIVNKNKPIIGYYGAVSDWFDFNLLERVVRKNPQWEFVVIGPANENIKKFESFDNFTYIPPVPYKEIPSYAKCWDVATIPFKINEITLSTSPVKLFEYMAMGLPIVTTPMPECKLYKSVFIAKDASEFEKQIAAALKAKKTKKYQETLAREASENTWEARVNDMVKIIEKHYKK